MKNGLSKIIIFILILLAILLCVIGYCYFKTDLFKTPDVLFKKYLSKNVTQVLETNYEPLGSAIKRMNNETFEDDLKIKIDASKMSGEDLNESTGEDEDNESYTLNFTLKSDPQTKKASLDSNIQVGEYESTINSLVTTDEFAVQIDELNEKYFVIQNKNLKELFKKFGLTDDKLKDVPDKIITDVNYEEQSAKVKTLEEKYINKFFEQISEDKYSIEKKVNVEFNGANYTANKYTLTLTNKEASRIVLTICKELIEDPEFIDLIPENDKSEFEEQLSEIKEKISDAEKEIDELSEKNLDFSVYDISKNLTIFEFKTNDGNIKLYAQNEGNNSIIKVELHTDEDDVVFNMNNQNADNSGELTLSYIEDNKENKIVLKSNNNGDSLTTNISFDGDAFKDISRAITITNTIKFNNIKITDLDEDNSIVLNDLSEEDIEALGEDIQKNIENSLSGNSNSLFGLLLGSMYGGYSNSNSGLYNDDYYNNPLYNTSENENEDNEDNEDNQNNDSNSRNTRTILFEDNDEAIIEEERKKVEDEVEDVISKLLDDYHREKQTNEDADPAEYLTGENIESGCTYAKASIVDGNTIKSVKGDNVYFTKIYINGDDWTLTSVETTYSESGEME